MLITIRKLFHYTKMEENTKDINELRAFVKNSLTHYPQLKLPYDVDTASKEELLFAEKKIVDEKSKTRMQNNGFVNIFKHILNGVLEGVCEDRLWYYYESGLIPVHCGICNIIIITGDKCRPLLCEHKFHIECICRYADRVKKSCPICETAIKELLVEPKVLAKVHESLDELNK